MRLTDIPIREGLELIEALLDGGMDEDEAIRQTAEYLDLLIDLEKFPTTNPQMQLALGAAEAVDGAIIEVLLRMAWRRVQHDETRAKARAQRKAERAERKAARKARRGA